MRRARPIRAVIFDLDGTLFDSLPLVLRAFQHALEPFGGRPTMATFAALGGPPEKIFPLLISTPAICLFAIGPPFMRSAWTLAAWTPSA